MKSSRFFYAFESQVEKWERTLSHILETVEMVLQVQRQWRYLENIFAGFEDIRRQLPAESSTFDKVNANWKFIMVRECDVNNDVVVVVEYIGECCCIVKFLCEWNGDEMTGWVCGRPKCITKHTERRCVGIVD